MIQVVQRYAVLVIGLFAAGLVCARAAPYLISPRGDAGPTVLQAQAPLLAMVALIICLALATIVAGVVGRLVNAAVGLFVLGMGLYVLDGRLDTIRAYAVAHDHFSASGALMLLALEGLLLFALAQAAVLAVFALAGPLRDIEPEEFGVVPHPLFSVAALKSAAVGAIILVVVLVLARSPLKGQMVGATFVGGMLAGLIARLISPHVQPVLIFATPILFGAFGYLVAIIQVNLSLGAAYVANTLPALAHPSPIDYLAGSLMGVAVGIGWARSFLHHDEPATFGAPAA